MNDAQRPLVGYTICFSGFHSNYDADETTERSNDPHIIREERDFSLIRLTKLAQSLGAIVRNEVTAATTILIARQGLTQKRIVAEKCGIPVVSPQWLQQHGCVSNSDVRVPPLKGYVFCSTQLDAKEEAALEKIITCNGGEFDRVLSERTSMLFIPNGWLKDWEIQKRRGRATTDAAAADNKTNTHVGISEKIRFAWNADIPVVEYKRFVKMTSLRVDETVNRSNSMWANGNVPATDFDTIAEICAVSMHTACGNVLPSQMNPMSLSCVSNAREEKEGNSFNTMDVNNVEPEEACSGSQKRSREMHSIQDRSSNNNSDEREVKRFCGERIDEVVITTGAEANSACNNAVPFFTHSDPFLQLTLIGCSPHELHACVRMSVTCRFLRTPIPTHVTDVVVVGSEMDATQLAQLRDQLASTCGVPLHRIVSIEWLEACYNCMLQLPIPTGKFCPAPLPLSLIPPTEAYIRIPSVVTSFFNVQQPQRQAQVREKEEVKEEEEEEEQQQQQKQRVARSPPQSNGCKSTALSNRQLQKPLQEREPRVSMGNDSRVSCSIADEMQRRHDTELRLVKLRVQELRSYIDPPNTTCSDIMPGAPLASGLFCFVNGEFSRTELAVVRALTKYGSGKFLKLTREEWTQVIRDSDKSSANEPNSLADAKALARRCSVRRRQFLLNGSTSVSVDTRGYKRLSSGEAPVTAPTFALRVIPHGDQRPSESFLRQPPLPPPSRAQQQQQQQRDPLRYLTAVTRDYIFCSLAAGKLLDPRGCFLFTRAMPIQAESHGRSLRRAAAGRPLRQSLWNTSRRSEKAPIMGVSLFFLCTEHPNGAALQRALTNSLASAVMNLGGSVAETLRDDAVTHCVVLDVAGMIDAGALDTYTATTFPHHAHIRSRVSQVDDLDRTNNTNTNEEETEDTPYEALLAARTGPIPLSHDVQSRLPYQSIQNARVWASAGRLAIVGLDWLEACLAWGVFLDEAAFALIPARGEESPRAVSASRAFVTPPPTPGQNCEGDFTLLGSEPSGLHVGSSTRVATHFNFTSPMPTPSRECAFQGSRATSALRQSCPRSTLRTPRRHCISAPRVVSPALGIPYHSPTHEMRHTLAPTHDVVPEGIHSPVIKTPDHPSSLAGAPSSLRATDEERVATSGSPTHDGNGAYTPIRSTKQQQQQQQLLLGGDHMSDCSVMERRSTVRRSTTAPPPPLSSAALMPQQDPVARNSIDGRHSTSIGPLPRLGQAWAAGRDVRDQVKLAALRLHVVSDVPERERLLHTCVQLSESVNSSLADGSLSEEQNDAMAPGQQQGQLLLHRNTTTSIAAGFSRVEFMTPAVRDADVVVVHELTQRESILAAIAAGLWVITPKALHECCDKQCLLPLRNLALYEWCPERLHPMTPDRIVQLARQCGQRRRQRQANGKRLFDDQCFLLIAANAGVARVLSLRTVIETGGGSVVAVVVLNSNKCPTGKDESSSDKNNSIQGGRRGSLCHRSSDPFASNVREMDSTEAMMQFIVSLIKGSERGVNGADDASSDGGFSTSHCWGASSKAKELLVLLDDEFDMGGTSAAVLREITESFQKGKSELIQAKRQSLGKQQDREKMFSHWHAAAIGDGEDVGMPHLEMLRLFTSEWLTLTIQDKQKAPECVVELH